MSKIAELLAKKKLAAAKAVEKEVEVESEEEEEEEKPAPAKKITLKKPSKVEEVVEEEDEEVSDEDEVEEEEEKPAPKKAAVKPAPKKAAAKVEEDDEESSDEEVSDEDEVEEEEEEKPAPKKTSAKPAPKKVSKVEEEDDEESSDDEDEPKAKLSIKKTSAKKEVATSASSGKKLLFQKTAKVAKEAKEVEVGGWMPREIWLEKLYTHLGSEEVHGGKFAMPNITTLDTLVKTIEKFLTEDILPDYSISLLGTKMRRVDMPDRIYAPTTGLERVSTKYHTFVPTHTKTTLTLTFGKTSIKGDIVNDNFVEGKFEGSKFIKGKWGVDEEGNETFTPTTKKK